MNKIICYYHFQGFGCEKLPSDFWWNTSYYQDSSQASKESNQVESLLEENQSWIWGRILGFGIDQTIQI